MCMISGLSDHHVVLCKVRLVGPWIKRKEVVDGARRSEKLREDWYKGYARFLEGKRVGDGDDNVEHMWEQVKWAMIESAREVCGSVTVGGKNPKSVWLSDEVKGAVRRKEVLAAGDEEAKERCMEACKEEKRKLKGIYIKAKRK